MITQKFGVISALSDANDWLCKCFASEGDKNFKLISYNWGNTKFYYEISQDNSPLWKHETDFITARKLFYERQTEKKEGMQ